MAFKLVHTSIWSGITLPTSWTDIDLSSHIGSRHALVFLKVEGANSNWVNGLTFRPKDDLDPPDDWFWDGNNVSKGTSIIKANDSTFEGLVCCLTDSSGVLQVRGKTAYSTNTVSIELVGYLTGSAPRTTVLNGNVTASWTELDLSGVVGSNHAFVWLKINGTAGCSVYALPNDLSYDYGSPHFAYGGSCKGQIDPPDETVALLVRTDENGKVQVKCSTTRALTMSVDFYTTDFNHFGNQKVLSNIELPSSWTELDVSSVTGVQESLCYIILENINSSNGCHPAFRPKGATKSWYNTRGHPTGLGGYLSFQGYESGGVIYPSYTVVTCLTDNQGIIEYRDARGLTGHDVNVYINSSFAPLGPPEIDLVTPSNKSIRVQFTQGMTDNAALRDVSNYSISPLDVGISSVSCTAITPEAVADPNYVDLTLTDCTGGGNYQLTIAPDTIESDGGLLPAGSNEIAYIGVSVDPTLSSATAMSIITLTAFFSKSMNAADIGDISNYSLNNGAKIGKVTVSGSNSVILETTALTEPSYTLTCLAGVRDLFGNTMPSDVSVSFSGVSPGPTPDIEDLKASDHSRILSIGDRTKILGWADIEKPEADQIYPFRVIEEKEKKEPTSTERLANTRSMASKVLSKIDEVNKKIDAKCGRFKVSSEQGVGSPLFQAMVRVFNERTTTITYDHYKRALEYRQQLAAEDAANLRLK